MAITFDIPLLTSAHGLEFLETLGDGVGWGRFQARLRDGSLAIVLLAPPASTVERRSFMAWAYKRAQIEHPGLPRIIAVEENEPAFVAFEWAQGVSLEEKLRTSVFSDLEALGVVFQLAAALRALHRQGLSHGQLDVREVLLRERPGAVDGVWLMSGCPPLPGSLERQFADDLSELGRVLYACLTPSEAALRRSPGEDSALPASIDLDRRELLKSFCVHRHFGTVEDFIQVLLPHLQAMIDQGMGEVSGQLESESALAREVERVEREQRELETRLRSLRGWLRDNQDRIEESARRRERCSSEEKALTNLELELSMLLDRPLRRRESRMNADYGDRRASLGLTPWSAAASAVPPRPSRMPSAVPPVESTPAVPSVVVREVRELREKRETREKTYEPQVYAPSVPMPMESRSGRLETASSVSASAPSRPSSFSASSFAGLSFASTAMPAVVDSSSVRPPSHSSSSLAAAPTTSPYGVEDREDGPDSDEFSQPSLPAMPAVSETEAPVVSAPVNRNRLPRTGRRRSGKGRLILGLLLALALGVGGIVFLAKRSQTSVSPEPTHSTAAKDSAKPEPQEMPVQHAAVAVAVDAAVDAAFDASAVDAAVAVDAAFDASAVDAAVAVDAAFDAVVAVDAAFDASRWPENAETAAPPEPLALQADDGDAGEADALVFDVVEPAADEPAADEPVADEPAQTAQADSNVPSAVPEGMVAIPAGRLERKLTPEQIALLAESCRAERGSAAACKDSAFKEELSAEPVEIKAFYIDRDEVTQGEYARCRNAKKCHRLQLHWDLDTQPATALTRSMAEDYCRWRGGRLPTSDEWMWAARGESMRIYPWGDTSVRDGERFRANFGRYQAGRRSGSVEDGFKYAAPVKNFGEEGQSPFGVRNLSGNVREWTSSSDGYQAIVMGGSWRDLPHDLRVTRRERVETRTIDNDLGFRCVIDP